jgi:hypothetical protein
LIGSIFSIISINNPLFDACFIRRGLVRALFLAGNQPDKATDEENGEDSEFHDDDDNKESERADKLWLKNAGSLLVLKQLSSPDVCFDEVPEQDFRAQAVIMINSIRVPE